MHVAPPDYIWHAMAPTRIRSQPELPLQRIQVPWPVRARVTSHAHEGLAGVVLAFGTNRKDELHTHRRDGRNAGEPERFTRDLHGAGCVVGHERAPDARDPDRKPWTSGSGVANEDARVSPCVGLRALLGARGGSERGWVSHSARDSAQEASAAPTEAHARKSADHEARRVVRSMQRDETTEFALG